MLTDIHFFQVKHSQRANMKPTDVWCIVNKDGSICTAHCTCMAGNSEVCSHVGAVLFAAEYANAKKEAMSCTDVGALWPMPSTSQKVPIVPLHEMKWEKASGQYSLEIDDKTPPLSENEINDMLIQISELQHSCPLMRIVEPFATQIEEGRAKELYSVFSIFDQNNMSKSYSELMSMARKIDLSLTDEQIQCIEEATRNQSEEQNWYLQRAGRITASKFKAVCRTSKKKPSLSLVKSICYPTKLKFAPKAISWGLTHEGIAIEEFERSMENTHEGLQINKVGLVINKKWPQLGASPDRLIYCECCLGGCLEVKCPYSLHTNKVLDINDYLKMKTTCLCKKDEQITLNKTHSYYFQVQMQLFVSQLPYCYFVIWSPNIFFKEKILPDLEFWEKNCQTALKFHSEVVMPELLGKYFTAREGNSELNHYCICNGVDDGRPMIKCDGDDCETEWFHFECVGLTYTPDCVWLCKKCK